ncbi:MAG: hypothetical protein AB9869_17320 [Verrucomicrobiia bacterium]
MTAKPLFAPIFLPLGLRAVALPLPSPNYSPRIAGRRGVPVSGWGPDGWVAGCGWVAGGVDWIMISMGFGVVF